MNWTGGALARHSRGKGWDKDAARQKQYFAKARARKNAPSSSKGLDVASFVPDFIPQPSPSQQRQSAALTSTRKERTPRRRLIHKQTEGVQAHSYSSSEDVGMQLRKRRAEDEQPLTTTLDHARQELDITEKRRRLLEKADWTGVITQKPALVDFSWQNNRPTKPLTKSISKHDLRSELTSHGSDQKGQPTNADSSLLRRTDDQENRQSESDEPKLIVRAHAPVIHQPQPKQGARSRMFDIRSPDLRDDSSTVGVLGASVQPSSRLTSEDIRWNLWLSSKNKPTPQQTQQAEQPSISVSPGISQYWYTSEESPRIKSPAHREAPVHNPLYSTGKLQQSSCMSCSSDVHVLDDHQSELLSSELELPQLHETNSPSVLKNESKFVPQKGPLDIESESSIKPGSDLVIPLKTQLPAIPDAQDLLELLSASEKRQELKRFVFDDNSTENSRRAREEAHKQTKCALGLKKSKNPAPSIESFLSSGSITQPSDIVEPPSSSRNGSYLRTEGNLDTTDSYTEHLRESSDANVEVDNKDTTASIITRLISPQPPQPPQPEFKFHQPRLFVGKLVSDAPSMPLSAALYVPPPKNGKRLRRRRDKERPDFRTIPNYDDDPIEED
ncbi:hypothetical protein FGRMN_716 [Fusarium graminum]|nr:hypothetical protein FGRMN_716 [Fusarium graminum]